MHASGMLPATAYRHAGCKATARLQKATVLGDTLHLARSATDISIAVAFTILLLMRQIMQERSLVAYAKADVGGAAERRRWLYLADLSLCCPPACSFFTLLACQARYAELYPL